MDGRSLTGKGEATHHLTAISTLARVWPCENVLASFDATLRYALLELGQVTEVAGVLTWRGCTFASLSA